MEQVSSGVYAPPPRAEQDDGARYQLMLLGTSDGEFWTAIQQMTFSSSDNCSLVRASEIVRKHSEREVLKVMGLRHVASARYSESSMVVKGYVSVRQCNDGFFYAF